MRRLTDQEKEVYTQITGKKVPWCVVQKAPFFPGWDGFTLWKLILIDDYNNTPTVIHEMVHVQQFKWIYPGLIYFYYLFKY